MTLHRQDEPLECLQGYKMSDTKRELPMGRDVRLRESMAEFMGWKKRKGLCWCNEKGKIMYHLEHWNPVTNWEHTGELIGRIKRLKMRYTLNTSDGPPALCELWGSYKVGFYTAVNNSEQKALCLAIYKRMQCHHLYE